MSPHLQLTVYLGLFSFFLAVLVIQCDRSKRWWSSLAFWFWVASSAFGCAAVLSFAAWVVEVWHAR